MSAKPNQPHNNPYAAAAGAYGNNAQKHAADPREMEARVLLKSAQFMQDLQKSWDQMTHEILEETLKYNRNIWMMFYDTALENPDGDRPDDLRSNILNLANFVFKREIDIKAKPAREKFDILIKINRDIAAGLMKGVQAARAEAGAPSSPAAAASAPPSSDGTDRSA